MYVSFSKKWFEANKKKLMEEWNSSIGGEEGYIIHVKGNVEYEIEDNTLNINEDGDGIFVGVELPFSPKVLSDMANEIAKTMNKLKTALEALK